MEQASLVKVVAAFVAGVVVALGSALIYVRVSDVAHSRAAVREAALPSQTSPTELPVAGMDTSAQTPPATRVAAETDTAGQSGQAARAAAADDQPLEPEPIEPKRPKAAPAARRQIASSVVHREPPPVIVHHETEKPPIQLAQNTPAAAPVLQPAADTPPDLVTPDTKTDNPPQPDTSAAIPARQPHVVTLESGTPLVIRLGETLSSEHNYSGDTFRATLDERIVRDGFIIAEKGSKVLGRIVNAQRAGRVEGVADLTLTLTEINTTDGQRVRIDSSTFDKRGPTSTGEDAAKIGGGAALGAIIGAVAGGGRGAAIGAGAGGAAGTGAVLMTRGKAAVVPTETRLTFRLAGPVTLTEKLNF